MNYDEKTNQLCDDLQVKIHLHLEKNTVQIIFSEFVATTSEKVI